MIDYNSPDPFNDQSFDWSLKGLLGTATNLGTKYMEFRTATEKREETEAVLNNAALQSNSRQQKVSGMDGYQDSLSNSAQIFEMWKEVPAIIQFGLIGLIGFFVIQKVMD